MPLNQLSENALDIKTLETSLGELMCEVFSLLTIAHEFQALIQNACAQRSRMTASY